MRLWFGVFVLLAGLGATMAADTIPATGGSIELTPMTHAHVQIEYGGKVIHVDPTSQSNLAAAKPADIVLVTDVHGDHMDPKALDQIKKASTIFVAPNAYLLELLMFWSDKSRIVTFGIAAVLGMVGGSLAWALQSRTFRLESFRDARDLLNHLAGGALMGFGGIVGLGCTIGQGLSGVSTLALGSILALLAIIAGAVATMKYQYWRAG
jgi:hypothetical protein